MRKKLGQFQSNYVKLPRKFFRIVKENFKFRVLLFRL